MKKFLMPALISLIIVQLFIPTYMIANRYIILRTGQEYKFKVYPIDPYDAFRGRYVNLNVMGGIQGEGKYGVLNTDEKGYAFIEKISHEKPKNETYIKSNSSSSWFSMPIDRYYMDEKLAPQAEILTRPNGLSENEVYVTTKIKNGKLVVSGLFINGMAIEDYIKNYQSD